MNKVDKELVRSVYNNGYENDREYDRIQEIIKAIHNKFENKKYFTDDDVVAYMLHLAGISTTCKVMFTYDKKNMGMTTTIKLPHYMFNASVEYVRTYLYGKYAYNINPNCIVLFQVDVRAFDTVWTPRLLTVSGMN